MKGPPIGRFVRQEVEEIVRRRTDAEVAEIKARFFPGQVTALFKPPAIVERLSLDDLEESRLVRTIADSTLSQVRLNERKARAQERKSENVRD